MWYFYCTQLKLPFCKFAIAVSANHAFFVCTEWESGLRATQCSYASQAKHDVNRASYQANSTLHAWSIVFNRVPLLLLVTCGQWLQRSTAIPITYFTLHFYCIVACRVSNCALCSDNPLAFTYSTKSCSGFFFFQFFTVQLYVLFRLVIVFKLQLFWIVLKSEFAMELLQFFVTRQEQAE